MVESKMRQGILRIVSYALLILFALIAIFPILWLFDSSLKNQTEIYCANATFLIKDITIDNYFRVLFESKIPRSFINSIIVSMTATFLTVALSTLSGYGFSRYKFKQGRLLFIGLLYGQMMPAVVLIIPLYLMFSKIGLLDNYLALILPDMAITIPMATLMLRGFFNGVSREIEEAAQIDGDSKLGTLWHIVIPIAKPGLFSVAIYTFLTTWEEFLFALNLTNSASIRTLPIAINMFMGEFVIDWGAIMSSGAIIALPVILLFLCCNKVFVKGLSEGGIKG